MSPMRVQPLDAPFGAEVLGVDPGAIDDDTSRALQAAFDEYGLLVLRDVEVSYPTQQMFVEMLVGEDLSSSSPDLELLPSAYVSNREEGAISASGLILFHTDGMWSTDPFKLVSLYAVQIDEGAAPTRFAGMATGWDTLPDELRARAEHLHVVQCQGTSRGMQAADEKLTIDPKASGVTASAVPHHSRTGQVTAARSTGKGSL